MIRPVINVTERDVSYECRRVADGKKNALLMIEKTNSDSPNHRTPKILTEATRQEMIAR